MKKYGAIAFAAALILIPGLATAGSCPPGVKCVATAEPGTLSLVGGGLLVLASVTGILTLKQVMTGRRSRSASSTEP
jgi:hypothetical protein